MLVLSCRLDQSIRIGKDIELYVVSIQGQNVRLGIRAPKDVRVMRSELIEFESQAEPSEPTERYLPTMAVTASCDGPLSHMVADSARSCSSSASSFSCSTSSIS